MFHTVIFLFLFWETFDLKMQAGFILCFILKYFSGSIFVMS